MWTERANISEIRVSVKLSSLRLGISERLGSKTNRETPGAPAETHKISKLIKRRHLVGSLYYKLHVHTPSKKEKDKTKPNGLFSIHSF